MTYYFMDKAYLEKLKEYIIKAKTIIKDIISKLNPAPDENADYLVEYFFRILIFLFPLFIYEHNAVIGVSYKDIPVNKPLSLVVLLHNTDDSVEILKN